MSAIVLTSLACEPARDSAAEKHRARVEELVELHARAWETSDTTILTRILHDSARFAYPRHRVGRAEWSEQVARFSTTNSDTRIYVHRVVVDDSVFAVEWQFATTERSTGVRTAVSDAIIGRLRDGLIVEWKEYLDGRVLELQRRGELPLDEGGEPYPWPRVRTSRSPSGR